MAQWTNLQRTKNSEIQRDRTSTYGNSGGLYPAEPGLTAGRLAGWLAGWQADEIWAEYDILEACCRSKSSIFCFV